MLRDRVLKLPERRRHSRLGGFLFEVFQWKLPNNKTVAHLESQPSRSTLAELRTVFPFWPSNPVSMMCPWRKLRRWNNRPEVVVLLGAEMVLCLPKHDRVALILNLRPFIIDSSEKHECLQRMCYQCYQSSIFKMKVDKLDNRSTCTGAPWFLEAAKMKMNETGPRKHPRPFIVRSHQGRPPGTCGSSVCFLSDMDIHHRKADRNAEVGFGKHQVPVKELQDPLRICIYIYMYIRGFVHSFTPVKLRVSATGSEALQIQAWEFKQHFHNESWNLVGKSHPQRNTFSKWQNELSGWAKYGEIFATYLQIDSGIWLGSSWMNQAKQIVSAWWYEWSMRRRSAMPVRCYWRRSCGWNLLIAWWLFWRLILYLYWWLFKQLL